MKSGTVKPDFFISYTSADRAWAEWIGWVLEEEGMSAVLQAWDFAAGSNFVLEMDRAAGQAPRTIAVLSPDYLKSQFAAPEWAAAVARDPDGFKRLLVPVRVHECKIEGLLKSIVYIDIVEVDELEARRRLLSGLLGKRNKPTEKPAFPGPRTRAQSAHPQFPGATNVDRPKQLHVPKVKRSPTDLDKRRFIREAFNIVAGYFEAALSELATHNKGIEYDFTRVGPTKFTAEAFVDGKSRARCKIWIGGMFGGNEIAYSESNVTGSGDNSYNEVLSVADAQGELALSALMGMSFGREAEGLKLDSLTPEAGAEYLWRRLVARLG
jgi:hypothetical protein